MSNLKMRAGAVFRTSLLAATTVGAIALATAAYADPVTLTWGMWAGSDAEVAAWQHVADMVTAKYPDITIKLQTASWPDYWTKLPTLAASNQLPDIVSLQSLRAPGFASLLTPLDDLAKRDNFDLTAFDKSIIGGLSSDGHVMALPYDFGPLVTYYNADMFKKAGLTPPAPGWTVADMKKDAKALTHGLDLWLRRWWCRSGDLMGAVGRGDLSQGRRCRLYQRQARRRLPGLRGYRRQGQGRAAGSLERQCAARRCLPRQLRRRQYRHGDRWTLAAHQSQELGEIHHRHRASAGRRRRLDRRHGGLWASVFRADQHAPGRGVEGDPGHDGTGRRTISGLGEAAPSPPASPTSNTGTPTPTGVDNAKPAMDAPLATAQPEVTTANWNTVNNLFEQYEPLALAGKQSAADTLATISKLSNQ